MSPKRVDESGIDYLLDWASDRQRKNIKRQMAEDPSLAKAIEDLQACFDPVTDSFNLVTPADEAWKSIAAKMAAEKKKRLYFLGGFLACLVCAALFFFMYPRVLYKAELNKDGRMIANMEITSHMDLIVSDLGLAEAPEGKDFELWIVPAIGLPKPLGVLPYGKTAKLHGVMVADHTTMAITMEPKGGSPTGQPTGPVIVIGELHRL